jgi:hypothetical protein
MSIEHREPVKFSAPTYEIDISEGWDTESQIDTFIKWLKRLKFYRVGLLFSGFDGNKIDQQFHSDSAKNIVYCSNEQNLTGSYAEGEGDAGEPQNAFEFATAYDKPAIAIYDPDKLEKGAIDYEYRIKDPSALLAIVLLK